MQTVSSGFSEEDLTRYLHITLEMYQELQDSLQPRLHLELGLLRLIHAGRLISLEEALAGMAAKPMTARAPAPPPAIAPYPRTGATASTGRGKRRCAASLARLPARAEQYDGGGRRRRIATPREPVRMAVHRVQAYALAFKDPSLKAAVEKVAGRPLRISYVPMKPRRRRKRRPQLVTTTKSPSARSTTRKSKASRNNSRQPSSHSSQSEGITAYEIPRQYGQHARHDEAGAGNARSAWAKRSPRSAWKHRPAAAMVTVRMDGNKFVLGVKIDPEAASDVDMLAGHGDGGLQ
jgi:DNA polymerase III gamma/tau subunit